MAKLGDFSPGDIIKINEDGTPTDFYVATHDFERRYNGYGRTLLVRVNSCGDMQWNSNGINTYSGSTIDTWLNTTYKNRFDINIQNSMSTTKIWYTPGNGNTSSTIISRTIFLLSIGEFGVSYNPYNSDGSSFYLSATLRKRRQWTRSPKLASTSIVAYFENGNRKDLSCENICGIYPSFTLPEDTEINSPPNNPSTITVPETIRGGADAEISWSAVTDPDGNLDGYIVERSYNGGSSWSQIYQGRATSTKTTVEFGQKTVMFRVCAYDTYGEKSGWRTSENRTVVNNRAPAAPPSISVPLKPAGGEKLTVTWTASTDADGNLEGYELERQWDGAGAFTRIYKGAALSYQDSIPKGEHTSVVYRVRAYDSFASYSSYTTAPSRVIDNNTAPVIACDLSGDLGTKSEGFSIPYTVSDAEQQEVTVVEKVGDLVKRTYKPTLDQQNTFEVTGEYFQKILNGAQTVQIVATDSAGKSSTLSLTFTKKVHKAVITLSEPLAVEEQITVAVLAITGKIPADATQLIELTNNGNDAEPVWQDATADVKAGRNYVFKNKSQSAGWAFNFRVTVERGESGEDGNIVSIQGGFQ